MRLNTLHPQVGARSTRKRVGRGIGSGLGKTGGRGHKGQKSRSGYKSKAGFEGGQMPLQRRLPKIGFSSYLSNITAGVRLHELNEVDADVVDLATLKKAGVVSKSIKRVKVFASGKLDKAITVCGLKLSKGARTAIEASGGKILEE